MMHGRVFNGEKTVCPMMQSREPNDAGPCA